MVGGAFLCCFLLLTLVLWDRPSFSSQRSDLTSQTVSPLSQIQVIHFHASWCGTCLKQKKSLDKIRSADGFSNVDIMSVDFDKELSLRKVYNVSQQSTIILLKKGLGKLTD